jgi:hypothetical protein
MTPAIVQMLEELANREPAYRAVYSRASGFMHSRVHSGKLAREKVYGPSRTVLRGLSDKSSKALKEDLRDNIRSFGFDADMHGNVLMDLMDKAAAQQQQGNQQQ